MYEDEGHRAIIGKCKKALAGGSKNENKAPRGNKRRQAGKRVVASKIARR
jgi:hypothetical protein